MGHIQGTNRHEVLLFPKRLDDYILEDNPVRFIDTFVDALDLERLGLQRVKTAATGRPAYHPGALLKLYLYGYLYRLRSSRRLERETHRNVELLWLLKKLRPDPKTIAKLRRDHLNPRRQVCRALTLLCKQLDLFLGELVAIDGSTFKAVHATERNFTHSKLQRPLPQIDEHIDVYLKELERSDNEAEQGPSGGARAEHLQAKAEYVGLGRGQRWRMSKRRFAQTERLRGRQRRVLRPSVSLDNP